MVTIDIIGVANVKRNLERMNKQIGVNSKKMTLESARKFRDIVKRRLAKRTSSQGTGHNTKPLRKRLTIRRIKFGHRVLFTRGDEPFLPSFVEYGTAPHAQPKNPIISSDGVPGLHPGSKPKFFWKKSIIDWQRRHAKSILEKTAKRIVR